MPGRFSEFGPGARGVRLWIELFGELLIFSNRNAFFFHGPFVTAEDAVKAEVNEHTEARFVPPLQTACAIFGG